eukprot:CAMPEP_0119112818 /NCGR_PEP_ID=MMETSP1180-20130426/41795_1 /TAXON_ID=3052 ORGANISM="Chlamydomonas cf sp, Strain CCMP681" /NCGR_SAMPLE_ID=MMETSP1180 /ASSEMBLY_ACC=CAM_ASM_000741 /LENGTH=766 /DNA_ID=CAMNT_0007100531 /DNA_START=21 /DNA_END=2321 /DNA_ORIENTATION=+
MFVAQVSKLYPKSTADFAQELIALLDSHAPLLDSSLRRGLVQALLLLRNRSQLTAMQLLPLSFKLFKCPDKLLRQLLFKHIISDIKNSNKKHRNEKLNKQLQSFLYGVIGDDNEAAAKKALAVCTELWRRRVWRDARTVNVIASAAYHKSSRVMLAAVKFFLGQDKADEDLQEDSDREDEGPKTKAPTREEIYKAYSAGTRSSKKKKQKKLARVMASVKKTERKDASATSGHESFAALHLLHDPQTFAERLFSARLLSGNEKFETRMAVLNVVSRVIGLHKLLVLNFYPFLQKYIAPHTRDVTLILTALVSAAHDLVPPDILVPVLRQLVDQFVHDKARPEVMTQGLKTARELCLRCPLIMSPELLQDLVEYKKFRNKQVASAARGLIGLFRELQPEMLLKKDRGRSADLLARPAVYGATNVADRVDGAELLEEAIAAGQGSSDDEVHLSSDEGSSDGELESIESGDGGSSDWTEVSSGDEEDGSEKKPAKRLKTKSPSTKSPGSEKGVAAMKEVEDQDSEGEGDDDGSDSEEEGEDEEMEGAEEEDSEQEEAAKLQATPDSVTAMKRKLAEAHALKKRKRSMSAMDTEDGQDGLDEPHTQGMNIEAERILTGEDFERIRKLKQKRLIEAAMAKHGLKSMSKHKKMRLLEAAEEEAEEQLARQENRSQINETKMDPSSLEARKKRSHDKEARMATVLAGRDGRERFGATSGLKKSKTGGLSEREKQRRKAMPLMARVHQVKRRGDTARRNYSAKHQKGHVRGAGKT